MSMMFNAINTLNESDYIGLPDNAVVLFTGLYKLNNALVMSVFYINSDNPMNVEINSTEVYSKKVTIHTMLLEEFIKMIPTVIINIPVVSIQGLTLFYSFSRSGKLFVQPSDDCSFNLEINKNPTERIVFNFYIRPNLSSPLLLQVQIESVPLERQSFISFKDFKNIKQNPDTITFNNGNS